MHINLYCNDGRIGKVERERGGAMPATPRATRGRAKERSFLVPGPHRLSTAVR